LKYERVLDEFCASAIDEVLSEGFEAMLTTRASKALTKLGATNQ
jgi:hypothetical protein